jgi:hypothetical protein
MRNYGDLSVCELREMCVNGELNADLMSLSDYERLFDYETDLDEPQSSVLVFCSNGLNQHEAYGKHLPKPSLESVFEKHEQMFGGKSAEPKATPKVKKRRFVPTSRWGRLEATFVAIFIGAALLAQGVAYAFGYNLFGMIWQAISNSDRAAVDVSGDNQIFLSDTRFYDSLEELLEMENLNVLFPASLPNGYTFTDFIVIDTDHNFQIQMFAAEPFIEFIAYIERDIQLDSYDYESDGIKYRILEMGDGLYQADFSYETDYYTIVANDRAILSEIINNLARE